MPHVQSFVTVVSSRWQTSLATLPRYIFIEPYYSFGHAAVCASFKETKTLQWIRACRRKTRNRHPFAIRLFSPLFFPFFFFYFFVFFSITVLDNATATNLKSIDFPEALYQHRTASIKFNPFVGSNFFSQLEQWIITKAFIRRNSAIPRSVLPPFVRAFYSSHTSGSWSRPLCRPSLMRTINREGVMKNGSWKEKKRKPIMDWKIGVCAS